MKPFEGFGNTAVALAASVAAGLLLGILFYIGRESFGYQYRWGSESHELRVLNGIQFGVVCGAALFVFLFRRIRAPRGQRADFRRKSRNAAEIADIVERFLNGKSLYPQEWNDFVECRHLDAHLDSYRKRCYELDRLVNRPDPQDAKALGELRSMVDELRGFSTQG